MKFMRERLGLVNMAMAFLNAFSAIGRFMVLGAFVAAGIGFSVGGEARTALLIVALSIGFTGVVFTVIGSRLGRVSGVDAGLRATGVAGTARCRAAVVDGFLALQMLILLLY